MRWEGYLKSTPTRPPIPWWRRRRARIAAVALAALLIAGAIGTAVVLGLR